MRENPAPTITLEDNQEPVMEDLVAEMGWARSVEVKIGHSNSIRFCHVVSNSTRFCLLWRVGLPESDFKAFSVLLAAGGRSGRTRVRVGLRESDFVC